MTSSPTRVIFVCLHGSAKSVIAAEHFRRLATESGGDVNVRSVGVDPDEAIPAPVVRGLSRDGFDVSGRTPQRLAADTLRDADIVVSFGCQIETSPPSANVLRWDDLPLVSDGYDAARDAIVAKLRALLADIGERSSNG
jgi:protein-tyrosine-phosphatase